MAAEREIPTTSRRCRPGPTGWAQGEPDLVVQLPEPYELAADGADVYRNFVLSVPLEDPVYVRAIEFDPGTPRVVHHAFVQLDPTPTSRLLDQESPEPGFGDLTDMQLPSTVVNPGDSGFFHSWTPGKRPFGGYEDMSWPLEPSHDIVMQLHMRPSGKVEHVQPSIAFYFAERPPTRFPYVIGLRAAFLDIPPGESAYTFEKQYTLPVDVDVLAIAPHAHYIGKELQGFARLPDGSQRWLLHIADWDFNWQGDYRFERPLFLPQGTRITQRFSYDNSSSNPRNPVSPPTRVRTGGSSSDEMGELWIQVLPRRPEDRDVLKRHHMRSFLANETRAVERELETVASDIERKASAALERDPADWSALLDMAKCRGQQNRIDEALEYAQRAVQAAPDRAGPHAVLGAPAARSRRRAGVPAPEPRDPYPPRLVPCAPLARPGLEAPRRAGPGRAGLRHRARPLAQEPPALVPARRPRGRAREEGARDRAVPPDAEGRAAVPGRQPGARTHRERRRAPLGRHRQGDLRVRERGDRRPDDCPPRRDALEARHPSSQKPSFVGSRRSGERPGRGRPARFETH